MAPQLLQLIRSYVCLTNQEILYSEVPVTYQTSPLRSWSLKLYETGKEKGAPQGKPRPPSPPLGPLLPICLRALRLSFEGSSLGVHCTTYVLVTG